LKVSAKVTGLSLHTLYIYIIHIYKVTGLSPAERVLEISGGEGHSFVLTSRFLYAAGDNTMKQLGVRSCVPGVLL
jgi:hypothetical protein